MHKVGFEPTKHNAVDLESTPFDHSGICAISMTGFEPATPRLEVWCAIQLRHTDNIYLHKVSILGPPGYGPGTLPLSYRDISH